MTSSNKQNYISFKEFIELAIEFEQRSAAYYNSARKLAKDEGTLELLDLLENHEKEDIRCLMDIDLGAACKAIVQFSPSFSLLNQQVIEGEIDQKRLLNLAIERNRRSEEIYTNFSKLLHGDCKELISGFIKFNESKKEKLKSLKRFY